jgi:hypothetical protein
LHLMIVAPQVPAENEAERRFYREAAEDEQRWGAYYQLQATEPQSLAYGMVDNPVGQIMTINRRTSSADLVAGDAALPVSACGIAATLAPTKAGKKIT